MSTWITVYPAGRHGGRPLASAEGLDYPAAVAFATSHADRLHATVILDFGVDDRRIAFHDVEPRTPLERQLCEAPA